MNVFKKFFLFIKNIFVKEEKMKAIEEDKILSVKEVSNDAEVSKTTTMMLNKSNEFNDTESYEKETLKSDIRRESKKNVRTRICHGDGLGIRSGMRY